MSRIVMLLMETSSSDPPSTSSSASPWQKSKTQLEMVMFLNPPLDSVPNLMRPGRGSCPVRLKVPSRKLPSS